MSLDSWQVFPEPVDPDRVLSEAKRKARLASSKGCWWVGCGLFILFTSLLEFLIAPIVPEEPDPKALQTLAIGALLGGLVMSAAVTAVIFSVVDRSRLRKALREATLARASSRVTEAQRLEATCTSLLESAGDLASQLPGYLRRASASIERARQDYQDDAFGPFWDTVEKTATQLAAYSDTVREIQAKAESYYRSLEGRDHTFPRFGIRPEDLPDPGSLIRALQDLVRKGQTNFQFAVIWEHRKTREVLIAGFRTLHEALLNLENALWASMSEFANTFRSQTTRIVEEQIESRRVAERDMKRVADQVDGLRRDLHR